MRIMGPWVRKGKLRIFMAFGLLHLLVIIIEALMVEEWMGSKSLASARRSSQYRKRIGKQWLLYLHHPQGHQARRWFG